MRRVSIVTPAAIAVSLLFISTAESQNRRGVEPTSFRPARLAEAPVIDGVLDDTAWRTSPISEPFLTYNPTSGDILPQRTEVWVAYDEGNIYFAFRCYDTEPDKIRANISQRDGMFGDDWVGLSMDALGTSQTSYDLFVNPNGIQGDILTNAVGGEDPAQDFVWESGGRLTMEGYEVEMRVPLRSLRFQSGQDVSFGVLFWRRISRLGTSGSWPEIVPGRSIFDIHARMEFDELKNPLVLEFLPSYTYGGSRVRETFTRWSASDASDDFGLGIKYGLTSSVTADVTWNPDFSQVESDAFQAEVNNRYPVFYAEQRPFFMEGLDIFDFAVIGHGLLETAVHTRNIVDPEWGSKITGTVGRTAIGVLAASDEFPGYTWEDEVNPNQGRNAGYLVGRAKYSLGSGSYIGTLYSGSEFSGARNSVVGGDTQFRFLNGNQTTFSILSSTTSEPDSVDRAGTAVNWTWNYGSRGFSAAAAYQRLSSDFDMDSAFVRRTGINNSWIWLSPNLYPEWEKLPWLLRISPEIVISQTYDIDWEERDLYFRLAAQMHTTRQGFFRFELSRGKEYWQNRAFWQTTFVANGNIQLKNWLGIHGHIITGESIYYQADPAYSGDILGASLGFSIQPNARLTQGFNFYHEKFHRQSTGAYIYEVNILNARTTWQFNRYFFVRGLVQYDSSRGRMLTDFLASFTFIPGTVLHLGYGSLYDRRTWQGGTSTWLLGEGNLMEIRRGIFFKASYNLRF
ncbi:DUF5916 domain-containing protein [Gemmatimonadota bacterium]